MTPSKQNYDRFCK